MIRPGYRTSEFWITLAGALLDWLGKSGYAPGLPTEAIYLMLSYVLGRTVVKTAYHWKTGGANGTQGFTQRAPGR